MKFAGMEPYFANEMGFFEKAGLKAEISEFNNGPASLYDDKIAFPVAAGVK